MAEKNLRVYTLAWDREWSIRTFHLQIPFNVLFVCFCNELDSVHFQDSIDFYK